MLAGVPAAYMLDQFPAAARIGALQACASYRLEAIDKRFQISVPGGNHVVYHAQRGGQFRAGALPEQPVLQGKNDYQQGGGVFLDCAQLAGVFGPEDIEVAGGDGQPGGELARGGECQDLASCVHAGADSSRS